MSAWKLTDWNDIIQRVNDLSQNPDSGCDALEPLEEVTDPHRWSVMDIETVRDRLLEICKDNEFSAETVKWKQDIVDEINAAIATGWCDCCDLSEDGHGVTIEVYHGTPVDAISIYAPNMPPICTPGCIEETPPFAQIPLASIINGLQVAPPGYRGRPWTCFGYYIKDGGPFDAIAGDSGIISCDGVIRDCSLTRMIYSEYLHTQTWALCKKHNGCEFEYLGPYPVFDDRIFVVQVGQATDCCDPE